MNIECPHCREKTYSLKDKFFSPIVNTGKCSKCGERSARPIILSVISVFSLILINTLSTNLLIPGLGVLLIVVVLEFMFFKLEPVTPEKIANRNNYLLVLVISVIVLMFFLFKTVF